MFNFAQIGRSFSKAEKSLDIRQPFIIMNKENKIMNALKAKNNLYHQTPLKILSFLSNHPGGAFFA